jgi:hypothetical protein
LEKQFKRFDALEEGVETWRTDNKRQEGDYSQNMDNELFNLLKRFDGNKE